MKIAILGYGVEGKSVEKYFSNKDNIQIEIFDHITNSDIDKIDFSSFDLVFRTPSIHPRPYSNWTSVTRYFFKHCKAPIIGVTGTKGKGTTCSFVAAILRAIGKNVYFTGNIGEPSINVLDAATEGDVIVCEMSSFQLWDLEKSPHIAVVLRIEPDHLDIHDGFEDYVNAKSNIVRHQSPSDYCIYYQNNSDSCKIAQLSNGIKLSYPLEPNEKLEKILDNIKIPGNHNRENAEAAILVVASYLGLSAEEFINKYADHISKGLASFHGLPHHIEFVCDKDGIKFYDDSYSASYPSLDVAVKAFPNDKIILIAGGKDRHLDLSGAKNVIFNSPNVLRTILIGETSRLLSESMPTEQYMHADSMEDAVAKAVSCAKEVGANIVLLSPGAPSFDMFKNFNERGDIYQNIVKGL